MSTTSCQRLLYSRLFLHKLNLLCLHSVLDGTISPISTVFPVVKLPSAGLGGCVRSQFVPCSLGDCRAQFQCLLDQALALVPILAPLPIAFHTWSSFPGPENLLLPPPASNVNNPNTPQCSQSGWSQLVGTLAAQLSDLTSQLQLHLATYLLAGCISQVVNCYIFIASLI